MNDEVMTVEALVQKLCPEGVAYKALGDFFDYKQPTKYIVKSTEYDDSYSTPVLTAGDSFILGYTNETEGIYNACETSPVIIFDDFTTSFHWVDFDFKVKSSAMKILYPKTKVIFRYLYYAMKCITYKPSNHSRQWISKYAKIPIPIPPLAIQERIVAILDRFTKLEAELEAELEARQKQYHYYRDALLNFADDVATHPLHALLQEHCPEGVEYKPLGEVGTSIRGNGLQKKDFTDTGVGCIHYGQIYTHYGIYAYETKSFVSAELAASLKKVETGDIIIAVISENIDDVCKSVAWLGDEVIVTGGNTVILKHSENPKYIVYYLQSKYFFDKKKRHARCTKVIDMSKADLAKITIPIPPLAIQERIVAILDKLDAIIHDISQGLPAELQARRKQYEYYRDKLLTFKELQTGEA